jgi:NAD(P)-dependent dehydrogenase (short-subunit alcohol dehydrogenase family)
MRSIPGSWGTARTGRPKEVLDKYRVRIPLGELVTIDDVVDASAFLLEDRAVTGVNLRVDGGWMLT